MSDIPRSGWKYLERPEQPRFDILIRTTLATTTDFDDLNASIR